MPARNKAWQMTKDYPHASRPRTGSSVGAHLQYPNEVPEGYRSPTERVKDGGMMLMIAQSHENTACMPALEAR
jgi:hypothetical protein